MNKASLRKVVSLGSRAAAMGMTILMNAAVTRFFIPIGGKESSGAFMYAFTTLYLVATITRMGAETLALRLTSADPELGKPWAAPAAWLSTLLGVPGMVVMAIIVATLPAVRDLPHAWLWAVLFASALVPINLISLGGAWMRSLGAVALGSYLELGGVATLMLAGLVGAILAGMQSFPLAFGLMAFASWAVGLGTFLLAWRRLVAATPEVRSGGVKEYVRRFGRPLFSTMLTALGFYCFQYLGTLFLGTLHREADVAHFTTARTLSNFVGLLATLQISYLSPQFAALQHKGDVEGANRVNWQATALATGFGALVAVPLLVWPEWLLTLYTGDAAYAEGAGMLRALTVAWLLITAFGQVYSLLLTREGMEKWAARITMASMAVTVVVLFALLPLGATWVAAGSMLAPFGFAVAGYVALRRHGVRSAVWDVAR